jgi:hypothetical protein
MNKRTIAAKHITSPHNVASGSTAGGQTFDTFDKQVLFDFLESAWALSPRGTRAPVTWVQG